MNFGKNDSVESEIEVFHPTMSQIGKRASVDWTIGKLLNIVLLILVLVLVLYGISTQSLNPLVENLGAKADEVLILFNLKDDIYSKECYSENVANRVGGKDFLKAIDMEGKNVILNVCKNGVCNISGEGAESYRVNNGEFEKWDGKNWNKYNSVFIGDLNAIKFNWELYNAGVGVLSGVKDLYDYGFTQKFVLYGDGSGAMDREIYAIWQNGYWRISEREQMPDGTGWVRKENKWERINDMGNVGSTKTIVTNLYSGMNDSEAINAFVKKVKGGDDDKVYWAVLEYDEVYNKDVYKGQEIGTLVGDLGYGGSSDELDDDDEVEKLKSEFAKRKEKYLEDVRVSDEEIDKLKTSIVDKTVKIRDKDFIVSIDENNGNFPIITLSSNGKIFGLRHSFYANVNSDFLKGVELRYFPVVLVKWDSSEWREIGNEEYYRLPKENFYEVYRATLISQFLKLKCK